MLKPCLIGVSKAPKLFAGPFTVVRSHWITLTWCHVNVAFSYAMHYPME